MAKPWGRYELGMMGHPKFLALNGNAIALWWEAKNYCDTHHTDGMIPREALRLFRFSGPKAIDLLTASCGSKPNGSAYAPLWEAHPVGFKMHDYLDFNDCREEVLARLDDADDVAALRRIANKERQSKYRAERKARLAVLSEQSRHAVTLLRNAESDVTCSTPTETETPTETHKEKERATPSRPSRAQSIVSRRRLDAAWEGPNGLYVPQKLHRQFVELRKGDERAVLAFYDAVLEAYTTGSRKAHEPGADMFKFWSARYDEKWPATPADKPARDTGPVYMKSTGTEGR